MDLPEDAFNGSNAFRRTGVKAVMVAVQKPGWPNHVAASLRDARNHPVQADHSTSKAGHSRHPGQSAGSESQAAQDGPQASPAASSASRKPAPKHRRFLRANRRFLRIQPENRIQTPSRSQHSLNESQRPETAPPGKEYIVLADSQGITYSVHLRIWVPWESYRYARSKRGPRGPITSRTVLSRSLAETGRRAITSCTGRILSSPTPTILRCWRNPRRSWRSLIAVRHSTGPRTGTRSSTLAQAWARASMCTT